MRWFWGKDSNSKDEAEAAVENAQRNLEAAQARWPKVTKAVDAIEWHRRENHFAELFKKTLNGGET